MSIFDRYRQLTGSQPWLSRRFRQQGPWMSFMRRPNPVFSDEYKGLVEVVIEKRRQAGVTQRLLADRLGKARSHISMIEKGQRRIDSLELYRIARCLGIRPSQLFADIEARLDAIHEAQAGGGAP